MKPPMIDLRVFKCPVCDGRVATKNKRQKYCSNSCRQKAWRRAHKAAMPKTFPYFRNERQAEMILKRYGELRKHIADYWWPPVRGVPVEVRGL